MSFIIRLLDQDSYIEAIYMNYDYNYVDEVQTTCNAFKAKEFSENDMCILLEANEVLNRDNNVILEKVYILK